MEKVVVRFGHKAPLSIAGLFIVIFIEIVILRIMKKIYLDNAATTPVDKSVIHTMKRYWRDDFANPSSIHSMGVKAKIAVQDARVKIAKFFHAHDREIIITSGGTEANNLAIFGTAEAAKKKGHFITTEIEHSSILECFKKLEKYGNEVSYLKVDENGLVNPKDLREIIKENTILISIGYANGEIGTIQPIKEIAKEIRHAKKEFNRERFDFPYFHTDASQAAGYLNMNTEELGIDMITIDAQKIYGPKGIGALFVHDGINIESQVIGGGQEKGRRSGTENVPLIVGFAEALKLVEKKRENEVKRLEKIRDEFFDSIKKIIPEVVINGDLKNRLPNNINISIMKNSGKLGEIDGEGMVLRLDEAGIICSSASACASGSGESDVVRKITEKNSLTEKTDLMAKTTLRFSTGRDTKARNLSYLLKSLQKLI